MSHQRGSAMGCLAFGFLSAIGVAVLTESEASATHVGCGGGYHVQSGVFSVTGRMASASATSAMCEIWRGVDCSLYPEYNHLEMEMTAVTVSGATRKIGLGPFDIEVEI